MREVQIAEPTYARLAQYAKVANISIQQAINDACSEWMNSEGDMLMSFIQRKYKQTPSTRSSTKVALVAA